MKKVILLLVFVLITSNIFARNVKVTIGYTNEWKFEYQLMAPQSDKVKMVGEGKATFMIPIEEYQMNGTTILNSHIFYTLTRIKSDKSDGKIGLTIELLEYSGGGPTIIYQAFSDGETLSGQSAFVINVQSQ